MPHKSEKSKCKIRVLLSKVSLSHPYYEVRNDIDNTNQKGGRTMKKIMVILTILSVLIIAGALYGTSSPNGGEGVALSLEEGLMAQYPQTLPDIMFDTMPTHVPF